MKKTLLFLLMIFISISNGISEETPRVVDSKDFAVLINAVAQKNPTPKIILSWNIPEQALSYYIYRKEVSDDGFSDIPIAHLDKSISTYEDTKVEVGKAYEYEIRSYSLGSFQQDAQTIPFNYYGFGYIATGIELPAIDSYGKVLILVDETMFEGLSSEISQLMEDLKEEGWNVVVQKVPRVETFDGTKVKEVKTMIKDEYTKDKINFKAIYLLGRVPVPYSGELNPDGHPDHVGAWPADVYYGYMDGETNWTDSKVKNDTSASRAENRNIPGDGKFDVSYAGFYHQKVPVGRVDFYNMPIFYDSTKVNPEMELVRQYLNKAHKYRKGLLDIQSRGILSVNFSPANNLETGFGSSGWRNLACLTGKDNLFYGDILKTISTDSYLWSYGCGGGDYNSAVGIGNSNQISTQQMNTVFTMLFGSYFGDWDSQNNFMRAAIASMPSALTCAWAGRPHWYFHHMAINYPIGYSQMISHNNYDVYKTVLICTQQFPDGQLIATANRGIHTALMGDPTLRMFSTSLPLPTAPTNLTATINNEGKVELNWVEPPNGGPAAFKYNVYRSLNKFGIYEKISTEEITVPHYIDNFKYDGTVYYEVRRVELVETNTASLYNTSRGIFAELLLSDIKDINQTNKELTVYPNPAINDVEIEFNVLQSGNYKIQIFDLQGNILNTIFDNFAGSGIYKFKYDLTNASGIKLNSGVYLIKMNNDEKTIVQKLIINR